MDLLLNIGFGYCVVTYVLIAVVLYLKENKNTLDYILFLTSPISFIGMMYFIIFKKEEINKC